MGKELTSLQDVLSTFVNEYFPNVTINLRNQFIEILIKDKLISIDDNGSIALKPGVYVWALDVVEDEGYGGLAIVQEMESGDGYYCKCQFLGHINDDSLQAALLMIDGLAEFNNRSATVIIDLEANNDDADLVFHFRDSQNRSGLAADALLSPLSNIVDTKKFEGKPLYIRHIIFCNLSLYPEARRKIETSSHMSPLLRTLIRTEKGPFEISSENAEA